jgi:LmbE family N-acetylglucosaminyl deacetylase
MQGFRPEHVLVVMAHPDDPEFTSGGTIARLARDGARVDYLICTLGDKGSEDRAVSAYELGRTRETEQRAAAALLGAQEIEFLHYDDGGLEATLPLRRAIVAGIRRRKPDTVICFDPAFIYSDRYIQHPDHRASGEAALAAIYPAARNARTFPELLLDGLEPHTVRQVYLASPAQPNCWCDIDETLDLKIAAMQAHTSQVGDPEGLAAFLRMMAEEAGRAAQPEPLRHAEAFRYLNTEGG